MAAKPKEAAYDPDYARWLEQEDKRTSAIVAMKQHLPGITDVMARYEEGFTGLMVFQGSDGDYVANLRKLDGDGSPIVCWATAETAVTVLLALDARVESNAFKPDVSR